MDAEHLVLRSLFDLPCQDKPGLTIETIYIHPTADVSKQAQIGAGTKIWNEAQVREGAVIGKECVIGKGAYVDKDVRMGDRCKLQNGAFVFHGFTLEDGVFLGPGAMLLNDKHPRAINPDGSAKTDSDWIGSEGLVEFGASVGGGAVILPGVRIGRMAMVGSGAVVTRDVAERAIVAGNPARVRGFACDCGHPLVMNRNSDMHAKHTCPECGRTFELSPDARAQLDAGASR